VLKRDWINEDFSSGTSHHTIKNGGQLIFRVVAHQEHALALQFLDSAVARAKVVSYRPSEF
jgi:hypothetical protein